MVEVITTPRLMAAAKEFNIGKDTLVDFLVGKGFSKDDLKPTAKLTESMYRALQNEFKSDKDAKQKAVQIDLPKGAAAEAKKKKDEEDLSFRKDEKQVRTDAAKIAKKEEPPVAPIPLPEVVVEIPEAEPVQEIIPVVEPQQPEPEKIEETDAPIVRVESPEIEGPKIIDKIDLSAIDSSTRPKKTVKKPKKEEASEEVAEEVAKPNRLKHCGHFLNKIYNGVLDKQHSLTHQ
jgi:translation initiation factor IF-2